MPSRSLFNEPFDDGTLFKLKIFKDYFKEWLPVFVSSNKPIWKKVQIFDLFAGMGKDSNGVLGSPLIILEELNKWKLTIETNGIDIKVILNEYKQKYYETLQNNLKDSLVKDGYELELYNDEFKTIFNQYLKSMEESANFLFLDQNGIKQITEEVFQSIINLKQTDFLFFISSSFIRRFGDSDSFQKYLKITKQDLEGKSNYHIHRIVLEYYRSLVPKGVIYYLAPFTIKKPADIYGLIFGSNHIYGLEKFLTVCWKHDRLTGEANFDIDNEKIDLQKPSLFEQYNIPKKIQLFEMSLRVNIMRGVLATDLDVYTYTLEDGFLPKHANKVLTSMKEDASIDFTFDLVSSKVHKITSPSLIKRK
jgi:three-Cys-motif partner protein